MQNRSRTPKTWFTLCLLHLIHQADNLNWFGDKYKKTSGWKYKYTWEKICLKFSLWNPGNIETSTAMTENRFEVKIPDPSLDVNGNTKNLDARVPSPTSVNYVVAEGLFKKTIAAFNTCLPTTEDKLDTPKLAEEVPLLLKSFFSFSSSFFSLFFSSFLFFY